MSLEKYLEIKKRVLEQIKPKKAEIFSLVDMNKMVQKQLEKTFCDKEFKYKDIINVGSTAKDTFLSGTSDIDIFVRFDLETTEDSFKYKFIPIVMEALKEFGIEGETNYASHPYVHAEFRGYEFDIVPCYYIEHIDQMKSAVDRTPLHTKYVLDYLTEGVNDEIRLLKQFMKRNGIYGANETVHGFSGYLCECLVLHYGSFLEVLENECTEFIKNHPFTVGKIYIDFPDPVDPDRNVASALDIEQYSKFVDISRDFLRALKEKRILEHYFLGHNITMSWNEIVMEIQDRDTRVRTIVEEITGNAEESFSKFRKQRYQLLRELDKRGFKVIRHYISQTENYNIFIYEMERLTISRVKIQEGPSITMKKACENFKKKNKGHNIFIKEHKLCVEKGRDIYNLHKVKELDNGYQLGRNIAVHINNGDQEIQRGVRKGMTKILLGL